MLYVRWEDMRSGVDKMLTIMDLSKLKITKVKRWLVYFDYDGRKYMLHESSDCYESSTCLYEREMNEYGKYNLVPIESEYGTDSMGHYITYSGKQLCYSHIDKEYFVKRMTQKGFVDGIYSELIEKIKRKVERLKDLEQKIRKRKHDIESFRI